MALRFLLDTNIVSELVRKTPDENVLAGIRDSKGESAISAITWHELLFGVFRLPDSRRRLSLEEYVWETLQDDFPILNYDAKAAEWFAEERERLTRQGRTPSYVDGQIAAVAAANDLIMVTRNVADFANFKDLEIENWFT